MECAYYFASLNGIAFTAQPEAPAFVLAGASGWAVNKSLQDATKLTACKAEGGDLEQSNYNNSGIGSCVSQRYIGRPVRSGIVVFPRSIPRLWYSVANTSGYPIGREMASSPNRFVSPITWPVLIPPPASIAKVTFGQ